MKKIIFSAGMLFGTLMYAQVGINNEDPKSTLDVTAKISDGTKAEGFIAPRLTGDALTAAANLTTPAYGAAQTGTIVYVTAAATAPGTGQTQNVTSTGYYYFDGSKWQKISTGTAAAATPAWALAGNAGTTAGTNFVGTTDNQNLVFKINNAQAGILTTTFATAFGLGALSTNSTGNNDAFGWNALRSNTTGNYNVGLGTFAAFANTTGTYNTALGSGALQDNITGRANVSVGFGSLTGSTGNYNIGIGNYTIGGTGSRNILIGSADNPSDNLITMDLPVPNGSNQMNIGNVIFGTGMTGTKSSLPAGNIGINTASPGASLEVNGITANTSGLKFTKLTSATPATSGAAALGVDATGNVVVTTGSSAGALNVTTEQAGNYPATATDDIILLNPSGVGFTLTLPTTGIPIGKKYYISNKATSSAVTLSPAPRETSVSQSQPATAITVMYIGGTGAGSYSVVSGF